jgi:hypothetical protein
MLQIKDDQDWEECLDDKNLMVSPKYWQYNYLAVHMQEEILMEFLYDVVLVSGKSIMRVKI